MISLRDRKPVHRTRRKWRKEKKAHGGVTSRNCDERQWNKTEQQDTTNCCKHCRHQTAGSAGLRFKRFPLSAFIFSVLSVSVNAMRIILTQTDQFFPLISLLNSPFGDNAYYHD